MKRILLYLVAVLLVAGGLYWYLSHPKQATAPSPQPGAATSTQVTTADAVKQLFADKYKKPLSEIYVTVTDEDATHAGGMVTLGVGGIGEGAVWFAAKVNDAWTLAFDGNGTITCATVDQYQFPIGMVGQCLEINGTLRNSPEQACNNAGGKVTTSLCCGSANDFPNLCLIGACGCAPANSHEIRTCDCGAGKCFNGKDCVKR